MRLNCITIDDEPLALNLINSFVKRTPFLYLKDSYYKSSDAIIGLQQPDIHVIFLDIQMPGMSGLEIARTLHESTKSVKPKVIFSTAHNQFAAESYEVDALSYLLKPFDYTDFLRASQKALDFFELTLPRQATEEETHIFVKVGFKHVKVYVHDIKYIQGLRDYMLIHLTSTESPVMTLMTLKAVTEILPADRFMRVQRSFIVNLKSVSKFTINSIWIGDLEIKIGSLYKEKIRKYFEVNKMK